MAKRINCEAWNLTKDYLSEMKWKSLYFLDEVGTCKFPLDSQSKYVPLIVVRARGRRRVSTRGVHGCPLVIIFKYKLSKTIKIVTNTGPVLMLTSCPRAWISPQYWFEYLAYFYYGRLLLNSSCALFHDKPCWIVA